MAPEDLILPGLGIVTVAGKGAGPNAPGTRSPTAFAGRGIAVAVFVDRDKLVCALGLICLAG